MTGLVNRTGYGRTRRPKNIAGPDGTAVALEASTTPLLGITATTAGYDTENQRYLHVLVTDNNAGTPAAVTVFGYCHVFTRWFEIPQDQLHSDNTGSTAAAITVGTSSNNPADQTPDEREYRVYEIVGIDRVAFVGNDSNVDVFAACSTF